MSKYLTLELLTPLIYFNKIEELLTKKPKEKFVKNLVLAFLFLIPLQSFATVEIQFIDLAYFDQIQNTDVTKVTSRLKEFADQNKFANILLRSTGVGMGFEMCVVPYADSDLVIQDLKSIKLDPKQSLLKVWSSPASDCYREE